MTTSSSLLFICFLTVGAIVPQRLWGQADTMQTAPATSGTWQTELQVQTDMYHATDREERSYMAHTYLMGILRNDTWEFGARYEQLTQPLTGFDDCRGQGLAHLYAKLRGRSWEVTLGDMYEQFGSGLALRAYEDRDLGFDNAIRGARISLSPNKHLTIKALAGQQRNHFDRGSKIFTSARGYLAGINADLHLSERWPGRGAERWRLGLSYVMNHDTSADSLYRPQATPQRTYHVLAGQLTYSDELWQVTYEQGFRSAYPSAANGYTDRSGGVQTLTIDFKHKAWSFSTGIRRSEGFTNHSMRSQMGNDLRIAFLPAFTPQYDYDLPGMYPFVVQTQGEWAVRGEVKYDFAPHTSAGGKYGTKVKLMGAYVAGLKPKTEGGTITTESAAGVSASKTEFWAWGQQYYHDVACVVEKRLSAAYDFVFLYSHQAYRRRIVEGPEADSELIRTHNFVYDGTHRLSHRLALKTEIQYTHTKQDDGDWLFCKAELMLGKHLVLTVGDEWNAGNTKTHYFIFGVRGSYQAHALQMSFGRRSDGMNTADMLGRYVPDMRGWYLSYQLNF